eukprot:GGOE01026084.1.p5 GENE.GGOE01026084.1~~GGOE01026084.1.p5  ORF type:complete len:109 (+),score=3.34 GGOE01026084.1:797-1123(+)
MGQAVRKGVGGGSGGERTHIGDSPAGRANGNFQCHRPKRWNSPQGLGGSYCRAVQHPTREGCGVAMRQWAGLRKQSKTPLWPNRALGELPHNCEELRRIDIHLLEQVS